MLLFYPYFPNTVDLDNYDNLNLSLDAALISRDHRANVLLSKTVVLYPCHMMWKEQP